MSSELRVARRVQFSETDAAGIVHFSNYFRYFEDAEHALWREAGLSIHPENSSIGWPRVSASCDFHRALKFEDDIEIVVTIAEMTRRTIRYEGTIMRNGERIASGSWTIACVNRLPDGTMKSAEMPSDVSVRLRDFVRATSRVPASDLQRPASA